jgi:hypothetical protein
MISVVLSSTCCSAVAAIAPGGLPPPMTTSMSIVFVIADHAQTEIARWLLNRRKSFALYPAFWRDRRAARALPFPRSLSGIARC